LWFSISLEKAMTIKVAYTVGATATGGGRNGHVKTSDGSFDLTMASPKELGGTGAGNNPEQLFAAGYAACYLGAMRFAVSQDKSLPPVPEAATVTSTIGFGARSDKGFGLEVTLDVKLPGLSAVDAKRVTDAGHEICPYSHATKGNISVTTRIV
jgi:lipoyl-dependent peroxiredoxin